MIGIATVTATTGDLTSILLGVPGEPGAAATIVDGHPMARRGEAARAMGASLFASLAGSIFGAIALAVVIPAASSMIRWVASPELFMFALLGVALVAPLSRGSVLKGLAAGGIGLMLSTVGLDPQGAIARFTLGRLFLWDGVGAIPLALGLFAIPEIVAMAAPRGDGARRDSPRGRNVVEWGSRRRPAVAAGSSKQCHRDNRGLSAWSGCHGFPVDCLR